MCRTCVLFILDFNSEHFAESCNRIASALILIQPLNAIVRLCQFLLLSVIIQLRTIHFPDSNISDEITQGHWKRGGITVILLENTKKHCLKPKGARINCILPWSAFFIQTHILYSAYMNAEENSSCSSAIIKFSYHHHPNHHHHHHHHHHLHVTL
jgi:hypothetical protein